VAAAGLPALAACTSNSTTSGSDTSGGSDSRTISVTSSDDACDLTADTAPAGNVVFKVRNTGSKVTEFYLYAKDGKRIVGEVENVGPGLSRSLVVNMAAGSYVPACKPGMTGKGIRSTFTVTPSKGASGTASGTAQKQVDAANEQYHEYVEDQSAELHATTKQFVAAYKTVDYDTLSRAEVKQLADAVNALSEPLSRLTAAVAL
jgi:iron uptake system component EfeO